MKRLIFLAAAVALATAMPTAAQDATLTVDATQSLGAISPRVRASNMGHHSLIPGSLLDEAAALNLGLLRFGGADSDQQDVRTTTLDLFVLQARAIGAEPSFTVRLHEGTPEAAADVVRYANIEKGYDVRYWHIGNEPNLFTGWSDEPYTTEDLNREWRAIAEAMLEVDPSIVLIGPDVTQVVPLEIADDGTVTYAEAVDGGHPRDSEGREWLPEFLRANGDLVDIVSIHRYPYPGIGPNRDSTATIDGLRQNASEWDTLVPNLRQIIRENAGRDIPLAITELNSNSAISCGAEASLDSHFNAIWMGDVISRLIRQQVDTVASWDIQGSGSRCYGLFSAFGTRPIYHTYQMLALLGDELLASESNAPDVSITAARRADGTLTLLITNLGDAAEPALSLSGFSPSADADVWLFDADHAAVQVASQRVDDGTILTLPAQSMLMLVIPGA
jgi:hypothetical protein